MNNMNHMGKPGIVLSVIVLLLIMMLPVASLSAPAAMTNDEYKALLGNPDFKTADGQLGAAYKACLASSKNAAEKKEHIQNQREWIKWRDEESAKRFKKGSPAYIQYIIDQTVHRTDTLSRIASGDSYGIKADGYFDTLDYDSIPHSGVIKPEHKIQR